MEESLSTLYQLQSGDSLRVWKTMGIEVLLIWLSTWRVEVRVTKGVEWGGGMEKVELHFSH